MAATKKIERPADTLVKLSELYVVTGRNSRTVFDKAKIKELATQIEGSNGILVPLLVEAPNGEGKYALVNGERRYRASQWLKDEKGITFPIPVHIVKPEDEGETLVQNILSNEGEPLDAIDLANAVVALIQDHGYDRKRVYTTLGKTHAWLSQRFVLAKASPEMVKAYRKGELSVTEMLTMIQEEEEKAKKKEEKVTKRTETPKRTTSDDADSMDEEDEEWDDEEETVTKKIAKKAEARQQKKLIRKDLKAKEKETGTKLTPLQKSALIFIGGHGIDGFIATIQKAVNVAYQTSSPKEKKSWQFVGDMLEVVGEALVDAMEDDKA